MSTIKSLVGYVGGAALFVLALAGTASAQNHSNSHNPNLNRDRVTTSAPCSVTFGQKAKVASAGAKSPSVTFLPNCGGTTTTIVNPVREVVTRHERVTVAQADSKVSVGAEAPVGGAKAGGGSATSGLLAMSGSFASIGYGIRRLLQVRQGF